MKGKIYTPWAPSQTALGKWTSWNNTRQFYELRVENDKKSGGFSEKSTM